MAVGKKSIQRVSRMATETEQITTEQIIDAQIEKVEITDTVHEEKFKGIHSIKSELPPYLL